MNDNSRQQLDRHIAQRFARLRAAEAASAPAMQRAHSAATTLTTASPWQGLVPRLGMAALVLGVATWVLREPATEDPAALYAAIMQDTYLQTDSLLFVSDGVMPAMDRLPQLFELESAPQSAPK